MPTKPGDTDDDLAVPLAVESSVPTQSLPEEAIDVISGPEGHASARLEAGRASDDLDYAFVTSEIEAVGSGPNPIRGALFAARALRQEARGADPGGVLKDWQAAFESHPVSLVALWGLRRHVLRADFDKIDEGAWMSALEDRLNLPASRTLADGPSPVRAALWLERGRRLEAGQSQQGRRTMGEPADDLAASTAAVSQAAACYRSGLVEFPEHAGLTLALVCLGLRQADPALLVDGLSAMLRSGVPSARRAALTTALSRQHRDIGDDAALSRAHETLRSALRAVDVEDTRPLLVELAEVAKRTRAPSERVLIWDEVSRLLEADSPALAVAMLREQSRIFRTELAQPEQARDALFRAWALAQRGGEQGHSLLADELGDLVEQMNSESPGAKADALTGLLERLGVLGQQHAESISPGCMGLVLRWLMALIQAERGPAALSFVNRHPEVSRRGPRRMAADGFAVELALRANSADVAGLAHLFEDFADAQDMPASSRAHALVLAGTLRERQDKNRKEASVPDALSLFRAAISFDANDSPAWDALSALLWRRQQWTELVDVLEQRLASVGADSDPCERARWLEDLVAIHRDLLDDPEAAARFQEQGRPEASGAARHWARLLDLDLALAERQQPRTPDERLRVLGQLVAHADEPRLEALLNTEAGRLAMQAGRLDDARSRFQAALVHDPLGTANSGLERLATGPIERAELVRAEIARLAKGSYEDAGVLERLRALRFRLAWHHQTAGKFRDAVDALAPLVSQGDLSARALSWEFARTSGDASLALAVLDALPDADSAARLELASDLGETLERAGDLPAAEVAFREALRRDPSTDAALGLLRVGAASGQGSVVREGLRALSTQVSEPTRHLVARELSLLETIGDPDVNGGAPGDSGSSEISGFEAVTADPADAVLRWMKGIRSGDPVMAASGFIVLSSSLPDALGVDVPTERNGLLVRAASRSRLAGTAVASAVHDQVQSLSGGSAGIGAGLADLPVAGRPERIAARVARAERNGGLLAYALDIERGLDAESRGDAALALDGFGRALARNPAGLEAIDGIRRVAAATGDRQGAARAGMRLGALLRTPARAAAEFQRAGQIWEELGLLSEASIAYWQAWARDARSESLFSRLRSVLAAKGDTAGLERLLSIRLPAVGDTRQRTVILLARGRLRLERLSDRKGAIDDFKRILKVDPENLAALRHLATLAMQMEYFAEAARFYERLLSLETDSVQRTELRLKLAEAYASTREPQKAIAILRLAIEKTPGDPRAWQRVTELLLQGGDWRGAIDVLRAWTVAIADPVEASKLWIHMAALRRDFGRDDAGAASDLRSAADLNPLGVGTLELIALYDRAGDASRRRETLDRAIGEMQRALLVDPLNGPRLVRLGELFERGRGNDAFASADSRAAAGLVIVRQLLDLAASQPSESVDLPSSEALPPVAAPGALLTDLSVTRLGAGVAGAVALWPLVASGATTLLASPRTSRDLPREPVPAALRPALAWLERAAASLGIPTLRVSRMTSSNDPQAVIGFDGVPPDGIPELVLGNAVRPVETESRFRIGRTLALIREQAVLFDDVSEADLGTIVAAAFVVAGAPAPVAAGSVRSVEVRAKALAKAMSRRDRKALSDAVASNAFEAIDASLFRRAVLESADRVGLALSGDLAHAVRWILDVESGGGNRSTADTRLHVQASARAMNLIRWALGDAFLSAAREGRDT